MKLLGILLVVAPLAAQQPSPPLLRLDSLAFKSAVVDHRLFPLSPGAIYVLEVEEDGEKLVDTIRVLRETKRVAGINATVVHDRVSKRGVIVEDTYDWYAQDTTGTVWYLGEDTKEYRGGRVVSTAGSWQAGVVGARAGVIMLAHPRLGDAYRQEYRRGIAEDMGRVVSLNDSATVRAGRFTNCLTTEDWSPLEPKIRERKTYCPGVGLVRERVTVGGSERSELVAVIRP